ncbi:MULTISPECIES: Gfo/Idh/MocA family protein [Pedobacter]|uniref:Oxidoreductase domain protein n=1 Tax=Pedobacter heparinus (strain ATCC 13125 / DSM 2366 / CIP 104194 / JCM 7457 / NBRC 12017 / NCIMB 9290 / NRRL B-14731 / HIM 762-3) TaxID=485917 RepID=C6XUQ5_PEDHD|nr:MULTISPECIES: Gfo/Idh/MocA family oxidoreductase [Pedobacter]ACU03905.1 oxidoreductase domain protein [Pedobacter heparinus DSM 2366]MBB5436570.1 putative dehydrogenase [Pedobacter sp. AK017]
MSSYNRRNFIRMAALAGAGLSVTGNISSLYAKPFLATGKRVGIIGLDTSHAVAFTKTLNAADAPASYGGYKVVAAYPKGSNDIASSVERIPGITAEVKNMGVEIVNSIADLLKKVDVVLLETNDGRLHLEQATEVLKARKPMFIDKPMAASLADATAIFALAKKYNTPVFSSSSLRYIDGIAEINEGKIGKVLGAETYSPSKLEKTHPDFFWYGIHGIEMLFTIMGTGCKTVTRIHTPDTDVVVGVWEDGRIGSFRGTRKGASSYGGRVFGEKATVALGNFKGYNPLLEEIVKFFESGQSPVRPEETLEIAAFMEAADESKAKGGVPVSMERLLSKAK